MPNFDANRFVRVPFIYNIAFTYYVIVRSIAYVLLLWWLTAGVRLCRLYFTKVRLGSPPRDFNVQIDTGSDILWVACSSCTDCPQNSGLGVNSYYFCCYMKVSIFDYSNFKFAFQIGPMLSHSCRFLSISSTLLHRQLFPPFPAQIIYVLP